jgi:predicted esterase
VILPENFMTSVSKHPLLVALHGAGNSESQFVIGHASQFVTRCSQNGWILACPRNGIATDLQTQLDSWLGVTSGPMALIGHSQGAAQALAFAAKKPGNVRAVVALGGSGRIGDGADYQKINFFLGIGSQDVAVKAVSNLAAQLRTIAPSKVEFLNYEGIGHLLIVVAAMDDTFKFLEKSLRTSSDSN